MRAVFGTPPLDQPTVQAVGYWFAKLYATEAPDSDHWVRRRPRRLSPQAARERRPLRWVRGSSDPLPPEAARKRAGRRPAPLFLLGGDTRASRAEITTWLAAAVRAAGCEVRSAGVVPTPAVAYLVTELGAAGGIVVSASHNPYTDNGVKLIGADGFKVGPEVEQAIEERVVEGGGGVGRPSAGDSTPPSAAAGQKTRAPSGAAGDSTPPSARFLRGSSDPRRTRAGGGFEIVAGFAGGNFLRSPPLRGSARGRVGRPAHPAEVGSRIKP